MNFKLGDYVIKKNDNSAIVFQITEFDGQSVVLKGIKIPVITVSDVSNLIKINKERKKIKSRLRRVK